MSPIRRFPASAAPRWGLGDFLLVELVFGLVSAGLFVLIHHRHATVLMLALAVVAPSVIAAQVAILVTTLRGNGPRSDLRLEWSARGLGLGLLFGFGGLVVAVPVALWWADRAGPGANSTFGALFGDVRASWPVAVIVFIISVLLAPLCEEILYRGLLWGALERRWGRWVALVVSTVVFALAHLEFARFPVLLVAAVPIGLARLYSGGLLASIVAHQVNNLLPGLIVMLTMTATIPVS